MAGDLQKTFSLVCTIFLVSILISLSNGLQSPCGCNNEEIGSSLENQTLNIDKHSQYITSVISGRATELFCCVSGDYKYLWWYFKTPTKPHQLQHFDERVGNCPELNPKENPEVYLSDKNQTLFFNPAKLDRLGKDCESGDDGWYMCVVEDDQGNTVNETFELRVHNCNLDISPKLLLSDHDTCRNQTVSLGGSVRFRCDYAVCLDNYSPHIDINIFVYAQYKNLFPYIILPVGNYNYSSSYSRGYEAGELDKLHVDVVLNNVNETIYDTTVFIEVSKGENYIPRELYIEEPIPEAKNYIIALEILGGLVGFSLLLAIAIKWWNLEIRLLLRSIAQTFPWPDNIDGKEHDGIILNDFGFNSPGVPCEEDENFIMENLVEQMEKKWGYKLFIWQRDSIAGIDISSALNDLITKSRRIVILLSPNFIERGLPHIILPLVTQVTENFPRQVIIIEFTEIAEDVFEKFQLKEQLQLLLKMVQVVKWVSEDERKVDKFWKELMLYMPLFSIKEISQRGKSDVNSVI